jgi:hypothetical protein
MARAPPPRDEVWADVRDRRVHGIYSVRGGWVEVVADDGRSKSAPIGNSPVQEVAVRLLRELYDPSAADPHEIPRLVTSEIVSRRVERAVGRERDMLSAIVDAPAGQTVVKLALLREVENGGSEQHYFSVRFRTADHPDGIWFHVDVVDFLEGIVRAYFDERPDDRPHFDARELGEPPM